MRRPAAPPAPDPWGQARAIAARLADGPRFPALEVEITAYGAKPCSTVQVRARVSR